VRSEDSSAPRALEQVADLVRRESGVVVRPAHLRSLEAALRRAAPGLDAPAFLRQAADPVQGRELVQRLLDEVTIQETALLRNRTELEAIDWEALLAAARFAGEEQVRLWVAGCATGEEAYSLALLACEAFGGDRPPVDVLGTDISAAALEAAREGRYRARAAAWLEPELIDRYFGRAETLFVVGETLRRLVRFRRHNLARDPSPPAGEKPFDLIACRNVLIYFDNATVERVIDSLERALRPGGTLVLGAADALTGAGKRLAAATPAIRPRSREPKTPAEQLASALRAADEGRVDEALEVTSALLEEDPLNAQGYFVRGLAELASGSPERALPPLRRALYVDPAFAPAAFTLGRAYDELGDAPAARRAYEQTLKTLDPGDRRHESLLAQVDLGDIAAACRARIAAIPQ
jgi:chemotaxis protein methyltransferase CheR